MADDRSGSTELDRRSLLKHACTTSSLALFGSATGVAQNRRQPDRPVDEGEDEDEDASVVNELVLDTHDRPNVEHASITFLERGRTEVVRGEIRAQHDLDAVGTQRIDERTTVTHSLSLDPELSKRGADTLTPDRDTPVPDRETVADLGTDAAVLERNEETAESTDSDGGDLTLQRASQTQTSTQSGLLDEPDFDNLGDAVTYVQTSSSECGPLCRTNLVVDVDRSDSSEYAIEDSTGRFETVDGAACEGDEFGDRFPCAEIPYVYDCSVPDTFNTTWHTDSSDFDRTSAEADYYNTDFPVIPRTTVDHSQETSTSGTTIEVSGRWEHSGTYGFRSAIRFLLKGSVGAMYY